MSLGTYKEGAETMSAILKLIREGVGMELSRGSFEIDLDGIAVGSMDFHETKEILINPAIMSCNCEQVDIGVCHALSKHLKEVLFSSCHGQ